MKRPKRADIKFVKTTDEYSVYICPHCKVEFIGAGIKRNVTRFLCMQCENEIIVNK